MIYEVVLDGSGGKSVVIFWTVRLSRSIPKCGWCLCRWREPYWYDDWGV